MSERAVIGFLIDLTRLNAIVGGGAAAADIIEAAGGADEVDELLGEWGEDPLTSEQAIAAVTAGALDEGRAYEYRRVMGLIAPSAGVRFYDEIDLVSTNSLPNGSQGRWNLVLEAIGLRGLAACWGTNNSSFPWRDSKIRVRWPIMTVLEANQVAGIASELKACFGKKGALEMALAKVPRELLSEHDDDEEAWHARNELRKGLATVTSWFEEAAAKRNGLLFLMDGSQ